MADAAIGALREPRRAKRVVTPAIGRMGPRMSHPHGHGDIVPEYGKIARLKAAYRAALNEFEGLLCGRIFYPSNSY